MTDGNAPVARGYPGSSDALPEWEDADVQTVYQMLCDDALNMPPNPEEHWEGWISRNIVRAMRARTGGVAQGAVSCGVTDQDKIETLQKLVTEYKARAIEVARAEIASGGEVDQLREALRPFAAVAESDIGQDETDADIFQPMRSGYNREPLITVGDMRRASRVTSTNCGSSK